MSREIKFRVYDKKLKRMLGVQKHSFKTGLSMPYGSNMERYFGMLMQYTGLKDIKGTEVYEGDIIPFHLDSSAKGVVKFGEYTDWNCKRPTQHIGFYVDFTGEHKRINRKDLGYWVEVSYVIGNIYENPELLRSEE